MTNKRRLWIISELFPPDETSTAFIIGEIANRMSKDYDVGVICGPEIYDVRKIVDSKSSFCIDSSISVIRTKIGSYDKNKTIGKLMRAILLGKKLYHLAKKNITSGDKVLIVTNPITIVPLISHLHRYVDFELAILVHDVFPENTKPAGVKIPALIFNCIKNFFDKSYSRADRLIAIGRDMKDVLWSKTEKFNQRQNIVVVENWADTKTISPKYGKRTGPITIQYAGNLGRVQGIPQFIDAIAKANNPGLSFEVWGTGSEEHNLKTLVNDQGIKNIHFKGSFLRSQQYDVLNDCDMALVTLAEGMYGLGVPSKSYNILAAGKPILFIGDKNSEIALLIEENRLGFVFSPLEKDALTDFLRNLSVDDRPNLEKIGINCWQVANRYYDKDIILDKFAKALNA